MESASKLKSDKFELFSALMICGPFSEGLKTWHSKVVTLVAWRANHVCTIYSNLHHY